METFLMSILTVLSCSFAADYTCGENIRTTIETFQQEQQEQQEQPTNPESEKENEAKDDHSGTN